MYVSIGTYTVVYRNSSLSDHFMIKDMDDRYLISTGVYMVD
jgi:hypothetical protein